MGNRIICFFKFDNNQDPRAIFHSQTIPDGPHCIKHRSSFHISILVVMNNFGEKKFEPLSKASETILKSTFVSEIQRQFWVKRLL